MRIRLLPVLVLAGLAITACGDNATPTSPIPSSRLAPEAAPHLDLVATNSDINSLIDQIFTSSIVRMVAHAQWNWLAAQVAACPTSADALKLQTALNQLIAYLQANAPKYNTAKTILLTRLVTDMSSYVNEAIAACPTT